MALTIHQKSVYLGILNATMILRSIGKSLKGKRTIKDFKIQLFKEIEKLTYLMDIRKLTEKHILKSIQELSKEFKISWGQSQKAINVILKYHFYLTEIKDSRIKKILHCPIDSVILKAMHKKGFSLTKIDEKIYKEIQREIQNCSPTRIDFDTKWDEQKLKEAGI